MNKFKVPHKESAEDTACVTNGEIIILKEKPGPHG